MPPLLAGGISVSAYGAKLSAGAIALSPGGLIIIAAATAAVGGVMIYTLWHDKSARDRAAAARRPP